MPMSVEQLSVKKSFLSFISKLKSGDLIFSYFDSKINFKVIKIRKKSLLLFDRRPEKIEVVLDINGLKKSFFMIDFMPSFMGNWKLAR